MQVRKHKSTHTNTNTHRTHESTCTHKHTRTHIHTYRYQFTNVLTARTHTHTHTNAQTHNTAHLDPEIAILAAIYRVRELLHVVIFGHEPGSQQILERIDGVHL